MITHEIIGDDMQAVVLTLNQGLQDIAERSLREAVTSMHASGGDVVVMDVANGEVRAMASEAKQTYLFFNNCHAGQAARSAALMEELLQRQAHLL